MTQHNYQRWVATLYGSNSTFNLPLTLSVRVVTISTTTGTVNLPLPSLLSGYETYDAEQL